MSSANEIRDLNKIYLEAVYGQSPEKEEAKRRKDDDLAGSPNKKQMVVTYADKKANTPAYQKLKAGDKRYKAADHLKDDKDWGYDSKGNSKNPVDIEKRKRKDDDLAGAPKQFVKGGSAGTGPVKANWGAEDLAKRDHKEKMPTLKKNPVKEELQQIRALVEKEVKVKDTRRVVDAIRAYDKSKDASRDATADSDEGDKEKADIEKKYAAKERGEIDKDDPNWKKRKYHTGIHGEEVEALKRLVESGKFSDEEIEAMAWDVYEGYQRNPEEGERKERESAKKREAIPGQASRGMPPRGDKKREEFEKWYAANVR